MRHVNASYEWVLWCDDIRTCIINSRHPMSIDPHGMWSVLQCAAVCCSVLQCVAVCCMTSDRAIHTRPHIIQSYHTYECVLWMRADSMHPMSIDPRRMSDFRWRHSYDCLTETSDLFIWDVSELHSYADDDADFCGRRCATRCNALQHTLQHTATRCNTPQHSATHCNTLRWRDDRGTVYLHSGNCGRQCRFLRQIEAAL